MSVTPHRPPDPFVDVIDRQCADPGVRADLRRGTRRIPDRAPTMHRYLASWTVNTGEYRTAVLYALASWIATHRSAIPDQDRPRFGEALALASRSNGRAGISQDTIETRLLALSRATGDQVLYQHMPGLLTMIGSTGVVPSFTALKWDLFRWPNHRDRVVRQWMNDFYRRTETDTDEAAPSDRPHPSDDPTS